MTLPTGVNGNIKYEVGTQQTSPNDPAHTFTHRPLPHRLLMAALIRLAAALTDGYWGFETVLRVEAAVLVVVAGIVLRLGLRRFMPEAATAIAVMVSGAALLMGPEPALEPDWMAVPITMAGVGAGLLFRRPIPSALLGGGLLATAAVLKIMTLPVACIGLLALLVIDRRRGVLATGFAVVAGLAYIGAVVLVMPHELQWTLAAQRSSRIVA
jgi:hypothetical protein